ncbi:HET-domain-containing protein [Cadophora sp. DSE1049]|nr:HET-domain-containing protein [Cadophora sp. DSE1049]
MDNPSEQHGIEKHAPRHDGIHDHEDASPNSHYEALEIDEAPACEQSPQQRPQTKPAICKVCSNIWKTGYDGPNSIRATEEEIRSGVQRGCPTCSLVSEATAIFRSYLTRNEQKLSDKPNVNGVTMLHDNGRPWLRLHFQKHDGGRCDVLLDLFSARKSSDFPVFKSPNCISSKLWLSDLIAKVSAWIQNCDSKHRHCRVPQCPVLPSRVIDVGFLDSYDDIKLVSSHGNSARYLALSYCWGTGTTMIQTTFSSLATWTEGIPWQRLPKTFQDAIIITRKLGIQYLWIDALCIVQDDTRDWELESANMANIYSNSYITIAATSAPDSHHGLFADRWTGSWGDDGIKIPVDAHHVATSARNPDDWIFVRPRLHLAHKRFCNKENAMDHIEDAPLLTRAWAFQERLLPSRTLHFHAEELVWECKSAVQCECQSLDRTYGFEQTGMQGWLKNFVTGSLHSNDSVEELGHVWLDLVSEFGALGLTHESDRLPALSGLASKFSDKCLGSYVAGIWEHDVARGLLFVVLPLEKRPSVHQRQTTSPSWSWASAYLRGSKISYSHIIKRGFIHDSSFQILGMDLKPSSSNPFSWVQNGILHVKGRCALARIFTESSGPRDQRNKKFVMKVDGIQKIVPLENFKCDGNIKSLDDTPLYCLLFGKQDATWSINHHPDGVLCEYVLVLRRASEELNKYTRAGLLSIMDATCSLQKEPVLTGTLV